MKDDFEVKHSILLRCEFILLERSHELRGKTESAKTQATLRTAADIMDKSDGPFIEFLLVEKLVLDNVQVDKVAHVRASVPSDILSIDIDFTEHTNHFSLIGSVCLGARSSSGSIWCGSVKVRLGGHFHDGERECVCDFERASNIKTNEGAGSDGRESLRTVLDDFHDNLAPEKLSVWIVESTHRGGDEG